MTDKNILAFHQLAPFIYGLKSASLGLAAELPAGLDDVDTPEKAIAWLKDAGNGLTGSASGKLYPLKSIFPDISLGENKETGQTFYYRPSPLSPSSLMPVSGQPAGFDQSLKGLWQKFLEGIDRCPKVAKSNTSVWLDCLLGAWQSVSWCLTDANSGAESMIPLYEKSRVATVLNGIEEDSVLVIQGDFQGIQNFIFTSGSRVNKKSAKLLRGRSFYVSLITEIAALAVLENLGLSSVHVVNQAAGKFLILAPNTEENICVLKKLERDFCQWFIDNTLATTNLCLAWVVKKKADLEEKSNSFASVMKSLFEANEKAKLTRPLLLEKDSPLIEVDYKGEVNKYDDRLPEGSPLVEDELLIGEKLVKKNLLCVTQKPIDGRNSSKLPIFNYYFTFLDEQELGSVSEDIVRLWDFSLPENFDAPVFNGIARRDFNGYVARFTNHGESGLSRYLSFCAPLGYDDNDKPIPGYSEEDEIKPFEYLACEDRIETKDEQNRETYQGLIALGALKGDVDNLGKIFREGLNNKSTGHKSTLCRMLTVSRMLQTFFTIYLPTLCKEKFPNTYTVFAGGDDFFLIGPWHTIQKMSFEFQRRFAEFVSNKDIHFSAGIVVIKPAVPARTLARLSEEALEKAKGHEGKDSVCIFGEIIPWPEVEELSKLEEELKTRKEKFGISNVYLYKLFEIMDLAAESKKDPRKAIWRALLAYNSARLAERKNLDSTDLITFMVTNIEQRQRKFRIPLSNLFYQLRIS